MIVTVCFCAGSGLPGAVKERRSRKKLINRSKPKILNQRVGDQTKYYEVFI